MNLKATRTVTPPRIAVIGTGLIGSSLALALRSRGEFPHVVGHDRPDALRQAVERGALTGTTSSLEEAVSGADVVILATPVKTCIELVERLSPLLSPGTTLMDVASVKKPIMDAARQLLPVGVHFVGSHPMAGSEHTGARYADALLFENATWVVTPMEGAITEARYDHARSIVEATGARILELGAEEHDAIAAHVSHLPQLVAVALVHTVALLGREQDTALDLAAGGFRDMTRIASSHFAIWKDILELNAPKAQTALQTLQGVLAQMTAFLDAHQSQQIEHFFESAHETRARIPQSRKGFLAPLSDVFVSVDDRPGALVTVTGTLYESEINIKDLELLRIREGTGGTFRLGLESEDDAARAVIALTEKQIYAFRL